MFEVGYRTPYGNVQITKVYDISRDENGCPCFLIYHNWQWMYVPATDCEPIRKTMFALEHNEGTVL